MHRGLLAQRDLEYRAQAGPDGPGRPDSAGSGALLRAGPPCMLARGGHHSGVEGGGLVPSLPRFSTPDSRLHVRSQSGLASRVPPAGPDVWTVISWEFCVSGGSQVTIVSKGTGCGD